MTAVESGRHRRRGPPIVSWIPALLIAALPIALWPSAPRPEGGQATGVAAAGPGVAADAAQPRESTPKRPADRRAAMRALADRLGLGDGATAADIGAGRGDDTWSLAEIVGPSGTVYSEEIAEEMVASLKKAAEERKLSQVRVVLGTDVDPRIPPASVDLVHMRLVYHHMTKPREMLREIWRALKPGGHLVVVDRLRGTLRDWVPREQRERKHFWIAETTVVREACEEGFRFIACADELSESKDNPFVLIFQRPENLTAPGQPADPCLPLDVDSVAALLLPPGRPLHCPAIIALGQARELIPSILDRSSGGGLEIVLEEWATQKEERPPLPAGVTLPARLTDQGDPHLGPEPIDAVFFLDTYHLLFHGPTLLAKLHERLVPDGRVYVLDRTATAELSRRYASHRRQIDPHVVIQEMTDAGFILVSEQPRPAPDRFLLLFEKAK